MKREAEKTDRHIRILRAAERLFLHYGPSKTTIGDIARACGIGVGSVYLEFSSKEAILHELSSEKSRSVAERMKRARIAAGADFADQLVAVLEARVLALLDLARDGQHACDLMRCSSTAVRLEPGFGAEARTVVRDTLVGGSVSGGDGERQLEAILDTLELAFVCLSPPLLYRMDRDAAEAGARRLSVMVVRGIRPAAGPQAPGRGRP